MDNTSDYNNYLAKKTAQLIRENFSEKGVINFLVVKTGKKWKRKLGHIKPHKEGNKYNAEYGSVIEINPLLFDLDVPEFILDYVILHELIHYFQGFASNHERKFRHPHKGGIVEKEMERLGWGEIQKKSDKWLKKNWSDILKKNNIDPSVKRKRKIIRIRSWKSFFGY